jgi:ABC-type sulfate transport system permease component
VKKWPMVMPLLVVGFYVAFSLLIPTFIGFWFDKRASHEFPLFTLIGLGLGTLIMVYGVYRMVRPFLQETKREGKEEQLRGPARILVNLISPKQKRDKEQNNG